MNKIKPIDYETAYQIAEKAHQGQFDKAGEPYMEHIYRVCQIVEDYSDYCDAEIVAILHDVLEDSDISTQELLDAGVSHEQLEAICLLTHNPQDSYEDYINKVQSNTMAAIVKLADLQDNLDLTRLQSITADDTKRINKYLKAYHKLNGTLK